MKYPGWLWTVIAVATLILPIYGCLDLLPIQLWDESRVAINAFELYKSKQWLVTTYNDLPDTWNTKPPLLIWMQVVCFKLFGVSELSLRLPSALAGSFTCLLIFWLFARKLGKPALGVIAVVVLVSSEGFIKYHHSPRTGDYDAMLTFFSTLYCILYYRYIDEDRRRYLLSAIFFVTLAVMTKTIAGLLLAPGLLLFTLYKKKLLTVLNAPQLYIGIVIFVAIVGGYYYIREQDNPGYFGIILENDVWGRYGKSNATDGRINSNFGHYFQLLAAKHFIHWYFLAIPGAMFGIFSTERRIKDLTVFSFILSLSFLLIISNGVNKSNWYDMPAYPFLAILAAIGIWHIYRLLLTLDVSRLATRKEVLAIAFLFVVMIPPYLRIVDKSLNPDPGYWIAYNTNMCGYMKEIYHDEQPRTDSVIIVKDGEYLANIEWYAKVLRERKVYTDIIHFNELDSASKVIAFQKHVKDTINKYYNAEILEQTHSNVTVYRIRGRKLTEATHGSAISAQNL